ncbi:MAG: sensor histidine kinase [Gammaproteobacteria bacterium]|nr:sensor histidine kinase [Gammaproteobacteria bacterium]
MIMWHTLYGRLALLLLTIVVLIGVLLTAVVHFTLEDYQEEVAQKLHRDLAKHIVKMSPVASDAGVNMAAVEEVFHHAMAVNPSIEMYLLGADGLVLAYVAEHGKIKRERVDLAPIHRFLSGDALLPLRADDPRQVDGQKIFSVAPLAPAAGYLYVILGGEQHENIASLARGGYVPKLVLTAAGASLLFALIAGLLAFGLLTRRLRRFARKVEDFRTGGFATPLMGVRGTTTAVDEIDRLDRTFDEMAGRLHEQMHRLAAADRLRRELVANVSHDLRTPLAAMQGYLDTLLLQHERLDTRAQREYIEIARRHSQRLADLIQELFDLAKLDSGEAQPQCEPFAIAELMQDVAQKFRLSAQQKGVTLDVEAPPAAPFVTADIGLIERVFQNLIDNALHHTPQGGTIRLRLVPNGAVARIEVSDTGDGIAPHHLPYLFERFYRVQDNRPAGGTGLGLAIARRILELHGSRIRVESQPGAGATFHFYLPVTRAA